MDDMQNIQRTYWIDSAKAIGIIAVFYGHIVEQIFLKYNPNAHSQFQLIYSFHIPLFFILSGFVSKIPESNFRRYLKRIFLKRAVPVILFNLMILPAYAIEYVYTKEKDALRILENLFYLFGGYPVLNFVTWFLICLFTTEIIHYFFSPIFYEKKSKLIMGAIIFYIIGWVMPWKRSHISTYINIGNFWFLDQAVLGYSFYLVGKLLSACSYPSIQTITKKRIMISILSGVVFLTTFSMNNKPLQVIPQKVVLFAGSVYGNVLLFPLTAIAGSLVVLWISQIMVENSFIKYLGQNTLVLMGLNGFFFHHLNILVIRQFASIVSGSSVVVFVFCSVFTLLSVILCFPIVWFINKYFPQLFGKPHINGPIIPSLLGSNR